MPTPLTGAATVDATCEPWPPRSCTAALFEQSPLPASTGSVRPAAMVGSSERTKEHDDARSRFGRMSGWLRSTPLSRIPTRTPCPSARERVAWLAWMSDMSHWHCASGSELAGAYTPPKICEQICCSVEIGTAADAAGAAVSARAVAAARAATDQRKSRIVPLLYRASVMNCAQHSPGVANGQRLRRTFSARM